MRSHLQQDGHTYIVPYKTKIKITYEDKSIIYSSTTKAEDKGNKTHYKTAYTHASD